MTKTKEEFYRELDELRRFDEEVDEAIVPPRRLFKAYFTKTEPIKSQNTSFKPSETQKRTSPASDSESEITPHSSPDPEFVAAEASRH